MSNTLGPKETTEEPTIRAEINAIIETLSVILQVIWLRTFKKKLFLMTPLHHHFEKLGWVESDIVRLFYTVGLILAMAGIFFGVWL